jgi:uncharacterized protein YndB with AHSA1/START domain
MIAKDSDGVIRKTEAGEYEIVFRRRIVKPLEKVWAALTVPERIADWLAKATIEPDLRVGATFTLRFAEDDYGMVGEIVELDPPRLIAWTWPDVEGTGSATESPVRFELEPDGDGCILTLTNGGLRTIAPNHAAGWHTHLEALPSAVDGVFTAWNAEREAVHLERYKAAIAAL